MGAVYQPTNVVYALFPPLPGKLRKADRRAKYAQRAGVDLEHWLQGPGAPAGDVPAHVAAPRGEADAVVAQR